MLSPQICHENLLTKNYLTIMKSKKLDCKLMQSHEIYLTICMITFKGHSIWVNMSSQITSLKIILCYQKLSKTISCKTIMERFHICNRFTSILPVYRFQNKIRYFKSFDKCYGQGYFKPSVHARLQWQKSRMLFCNTSHSYSWPGNIHIHIQ